MTDNLHEWQKKLIDKIQKHGAKPVVYRRSKTPFEAYCRYLGIWGKK